MVKFSIKQGVSLLLIVSTLIISLFNVYFALNAGLADVETLKARVQLSNIKNSGAIPDDATWSALHDNFGVASRLAPDSAQYHEDLAFLYAIRGVSALKVAGNSNPDLLAAIIQYRASIQRRPMAGATWANLSLASFYAQKDHAELAKLIDISLLYGKNDPATLTSLFFIMSRGGNQVFPKQQAEVMASFRNLKEAARQDILRAAR